MSPSSVQGYAALALGQPLELLTYPAPHLGEHDVRVAVTHCGVCFTDIQGIDDYYGITEFPFVPGHEIVGHVEARGRTVSGLKEGDRVGIGWQGRSCTRCEWCTQGEEQLCQRIAEMGTWERHGGFASSVTVDGSFAYLLPAAMSSDVAAVLMCAGISVYSPLRTYGAGSGQRIGIFGVGGLGHLAIQFAHALGCEVGSSWSGFRSCRRIRPKWSPTSSRSRDLSSATGPRCARCSRSPSSTASRPESNGWP